MTTIGKNTLTGSGAGLSSIDPKIFSGGVAAVIPANHEVISAYIGWADIGLTGSGTIEIGLYDITDGVNNASLIMSTVQTIAFDNDALSGDQFLSVTGLSINLAVYSGKTLAASLANPSGSSFPVKYDSSGTRNDHNVVTSTLPEVFVLDASQTQVHAVYFETAIITGISTSNIDTDDDVYPAQPNSKVNGSSYNAARGSGKLELLNNAETVTVNQSVGDSDWSDIQVNIPSIIQGGLKYASDHKVKVINNSGESAVHLFQLSPSPGKQYIDVVNPITGLVDGEITSVLYNSNAVTGDQWECDTVTSLGNAITPYADGTVDIDGGGTQAQTFTARAWDETDRAWSTSVIFTLNSSIASVSGSVSVDWDLLSLVSNSKELSWALLNPVSAKMLINWDLAGKVSAQLDAQWSLLESVGISAEMKWDLSISVASQIQAKWSSVQSAEASIELAWASLVATSNSLEFRWDLLVRTPIHVMLILK